jgi:DNA-binding NarL/FixJ family response regulator
MAQGEVRAERPGSFEGGRASIRPRSAARGKALARGTQVLIVDPAGQARQELRGLLSAQAGLEVVASCRTIDAAIAESTARPLDVVLVGDGFWEPERLEAIRRLVENSPSTAVLALTDRPELEGFLASVRAGARGYLAASADAAGLVDAVRTLGAGGCIVEPGILRELFAYLSGAGAAMDHATGAAERISPLARLSPREREVLRLLAQGKGNKEIASMLWISAGTAKTHVRHIFKKLKVSDRTGAVLAALDIDPSKLLPAA